MKKTSFILLIVLCVSLVANVTLAVNYSASHQKVVQSNKKIHLLSQQTNTLKRSQKHLMMAIRPVIPPVKDPKSYKYDRWETGGNVMSDSEALAIYDENPSKYKNVGTDSIMAPNPFGDKNINRAGVTDEVAKRYLLRMIDNPKERTRQRVDWLYYAVSIDKHNLKHKQIYADILNRWQNNYDFSTIAEDRKTIENLQG
ncbi:DUF6241 domain-containing protein [Sporolactobacillus vineae]|uniref:DUF6241 domain-containing protein n=1 Tax=Sporolactobacillus vineae TaxID=444463 RepID=UPI000289E33C|nr:DUF6241 domain-containing protein [Sporolactobacillus vineae]